MEDIDSNKTITKGNPVERNLNMSEINTLENPLENPLGNPDQSQKEAVEQKLSYATEVSTQLFLFVYYIDFQNNLQIVDVFETNAIQFELGSTYESNKSNEHNMKIHNHIRVEKTSFFKSQITIDSDNWTLEPKPMRNFQNIKENENGFIVFCAYDREKNLKNSYYTKGNIFYCNSGTGSSGTGYSGIGSSQQIRDFNDTMTFIQETILLQSVFDNDMMSGGVGNVLDKARDLGDQYGKTGPTFSKADRFAKPKTTLDNQPTGKAQLNTGQTRKVVPAVKPAAKTVKNVPIKNVPVKNVPIKNVVPVTINTFDVNKAYNTIYINSIHPDILKQTLGETTDNIDNIIKFLYIDISIKNQEYEKYDFLYRCIHEFYYSLKDDMTELKKEMNYYGALKINKFIEKYNAIGPKYFNESFIIHKNDFIKFKKYVSKKFDDIKSTSTKNAFTDSNAFSKFLERFKETNWTPSDEMILKIKQYLESTNNGINTYLKITNFEEKNNSQYKTANNERYTVDVIKDSKMVKMQYASENKPFYIINEDGSISPNPQVQEINYDSKFTFGPFNHVFEQTKTSENIVEEVQPLIKQIKDGKPVFILGYGASGSGKTSSLVYFAKENKPGILIYLCNKLASDGYQNIELKCMEFFKPSDDDNKYKKIDGGVYTESENFTFNYNNRFVLSKNVNYTINHPYKIKDKPSKYVFNQNTSLEDVIYYLIETDRLIKATPNNPNSSRSHVLCFLKLTSVDKKDANIIFGDLAGVENEFQCNTVNDIRKMFNKKRDNTDEKFYKNESTTENGETIMDPYKGGQKLVLQDYDNKIFDNRYFTFNQASILNMFKSELSKYIIINNNFNLNNSIYKFVEMILVHIGIIKEVDDTRTEIQTSITPINKSLFNGLNELNKQILSGALQSTNFEKPQININAIESLKQEPLVALLYQAIYGWNMSGTNTFRKKKESTEFNWEKRGKTMLKNLLASGLIDTFLDKIKECVLVNKIMKNVCENRVTEGSFINKSLQQLTDDFLNIINYKNKENVYYVPNFDKECLQSYCSESYCFSVKAENVKDSKPKSIIIQKIFEHLKYEDFTEFCKNLEIYVFCFFNWSRTANNPPPVSYVDINHLKKMLYLSDSESFNTNEFNNILTERIEKAKEIAGKNAATDYVVLQLIQLQTYVAGKDNIYSDFEKKVSEIFEKIENINAATAIGTIEFLDKIAKLNTIKNSCQV